MAAHELSVAFTDRTGGTLEAGVRPVVATCRFPDVAEWLCERPLGRRLAQRERVERAAFKEISGERRAANSHSFSVGSRAFARRAKASAS